MIEINCYKSSNYITLFLYFAGAEVEFEPDVDFKPLVHLEEVETKTGE